MDVRYDKPPLLEAIFEVRFPQATSWDLAIPGLIYERLKERFPQREAKIAQEMNIVSGPEGFKQEIRTTERSLFFQSDRKMLVQVGPRVVSVHCLKPYPGWATFKSAIEEIYNALGEVVETKQLEKIALRYINRIEITESKIEPKDYFNLYIYLGEKLPQDMVNFNIECIFPYERERDLCRLQFATLPPPTPSQPMFNFLLDIGYFLATPQVIKSEEVLNWVEIAHQRIQDIFEGSITNKLRALFRGE